MVYRKRRVRTSAVGMTREAAKLSLSENPKFVEGTEILSLTREGDMWVASLLEPVDPKTAGFPFDDNDESSKSESDTPKDEGSDASSDDSGSKPDSDDSSSDKDSDSDGPKGDEKPKGEKAEVAELLQLVHQIVEHLGIGADPVVPGAEDVPLPGLDGPPPPDGPGHSDDPRAPGNENIQVHRTKMKPGETPPGTTPIGAPAFSSVHTAGMRSFDAIDDTPGKTIKQAKAELDAEFGPQGFKVVQALRQPDGRVAAKLVRQ